MEGWAIAVIVFFAIIFGLVGLGIAICFGCFGAWGGFFVGKATTSGSKKSDQRPLLATSTRGRGDWKFASLKSGGVVMSGR